MFLKGAAWAASLRRRVAAYGNSDGCGLILWPSSKDTRLAFGEVEHVDSLANRRLIQELTDRAPPARALRLRTLSRPRAGPRLAPARLGTVRATAGQLLGPSPTDRQIAGRKSLPKTARVALLITQAEADLDTARAEHQRLTEQLDQAAADTSQQPQPADSPQPRTAAQPPARQAAPRRHEARAWPPNSHQSALLPAVPLPCQNEGGAAVICGRLREPRVPPDLVRSRQGSDPRRPLSSRSCCRAASVLGR